MKSGKTSHTPGISRLNKAWNAAVLEIKRVREAGRDPLQDEACIPLIRMIAEMTWVGFSDSQTILHFKKHSP